MQYSTKGFLYLNLILIVLAINSCKSQAETIENPNTIVPTNEKQKLPIETKLHELFHLKNRINTCEKQRLFMAEHLTLRDSIYFEGKYGIIPEVVTFLEVIGEDRYKSREVPKNMHLFYINTQCINEIKSIDERFFFFFKEAGQPLLQRLKKKDHKRFAITIWLTNYDCQMSFQVYPDNSISDMKIQCVRDIY